MIKENLQRKKLYPIEKEINDDYNVIKRRFLRKIFKKVNSIKRELDDKSVIKGEFK